MTYNENKWIALGKKTIADMKCEGAPTQGRVWSTTGCRYLRDELIAELRAAGKNGKTLFDKETTTEVENWLKGSLNELIEQVSKKTESGFLSNASAAAKAAGFKPSDIEVEGLKD